MKKWIALALAAVLLVLAWVAAGPYMTIRAIQQAVQAQDAGELAEQVDFPALRASLKAQMVDALIRQAGPEVQSAQRLRQVDARAQLAFVPQHALQDGCIRAHRGAPSVAAPC